MPHAGNDVREARPSDDHDPHEGAADPHWTRMSLSGTPCRSEDACSILCADYMRLERGGVAPARAS